MIHAHESDVALPGFPSENRWILMYRHARAVVSQNVYRLLAWCGATT
jgi:hypothetical protein